MPAKIKSSKEPSQAAVMEYEKGKQHFDRKEFKEAADAFNKVWPQK